MEEREFRLRMSCRHRGDDNEVGDLQLQMLLEGEWTPVEVTVEGSSPYRVFLFSVMLCENSYLYMNATERGVLLDRTEAEVYFRTVNMEGNIGAESRVDPRRSSPHAETRPCSRRAAPRRLT